ncbi:unnamed protein product [Hermetia illucens]|uniref:Septin-type G domain-containing protein n=1 Tax=Hermetia illucens TaxID=343691 RepID=A0A7R8UEL2_HERIL|nr:unnamed protein product [Hermetia illucens]
MKVSKCLLKVCEQFGKFEFLRKGGWRKSIIKRIQLPLQTAREICNDNINQLSPIRLSKERIEEGFKLYLDTVVSLARIKNKIASRDVYYNIHHVRTMAKGKCHLMFSGTMNVVLVISKADSQTRKEIQRLQTSILQEIENGVKIYLNCNNDEVEDYKEQIKQLTETDLSTMQVMVL